MGAGERKDHGLISRDRFRPAATRARAMAEQRLFQPRLIPTLGQRPGDARRLGPFQVFSDGALRDRTTASDLVLAQT